MENLRHPVAGKDNKLVSSVEDAWNTLALIDADYEIFRSAGVLLAFEP